MSESQSGHTVRFLFGGGGGGGGLPHPCGSTTEAKMTTLEYTPRKL